MIDNFSARTPQHVAKSIVKGLLSLHFGQKISSGVNQSVNLTFWISEPCQDLVALFAIEQTEEGLRISIEKHYRLVQPEDLSPEELESYRHYSQ